MLRGQNYFALFGFHSFSNIEETIAIRRLGMSDMEGSEVEVELLQELIGENIVIVIHQNGMTILMDEDIEDRSDEQLKMFGRLYVAAKPSFVLRFFLILAVGILLAWEYLEDLYKSLVKKP